MSSSRRPTKTQIKLSTSRPSGSSTRRTGGNDRRRTSSTRRGAEDDRRRTSSTRRGAEDDRKGGRKPKKQDNTKLIIGMCVGGFFLLILIIVAASSGGKKARYSNNNSGYNTNSGNKSSFTVPINDRKKIFKEYLAGERKIEAAASAKMDQLSGPAIRQEGPKIQAQKRTELGNLRVKLSEKYRKKYPKASGTFVKKIIDEGIDKGWS